ncbi:MAG: TauD/TfdA family dioxygenase [Rhodospirillaceae bacterium]|nr:TauD/TfdA family dioxygenase [Rhodospirillaceae bacterium]
MKFEVVPLGAALGAEIRGLDLRQEIDAETAAALRAAWHRFHVLVFRGQTIDIEQQRRFVRHFGEIQPPRSRPGERANPDIMYVANVKVDGEMGDLPEGDMQFHADQCYYETVAGGAVLYAIEVPKHGGNTLFGSTAHAYATLPAALRARIDGREVEFAYDYRQNAYRRPTESLANAPRAVHPAVIAHPATGEPHLFVNRLMAERIVGMARAESDALLAALFDHMEQPEMIYEHVWAPGDVVVWDNIATIHARTDFDPAEPRLLRRLAIKGARPAPYRAPAAA